MRSGQYPYRAGLLAVIGQRPVCIAVGAHDLRQQQRVGGVGLGSGHGVPVAVTADRPRVDRIDPMPSGAKRCDQQAAVGLDRDVDRHQPLRVEMVGEQRAQRGEAGQVVGDAALGQQSPRRVDDRDVVVLLGPVDPAEDFL